MKLALAALLLAASVRAADAGSCIPAFDYAAFGKNSLTFGGGAKTDSYNSKTGTYASTQQNAYGNVGTNGDDCGAVTLNGAPTTINGDASYGDGGSLCAVSGGGSVTGLKVKLDADVVLPSVTVPVVGTYQGDQTVGSHDTLNLTPNATYGAVSATGGSHLVLSTGTYAMSSLSLSGNSDLTVGSGPIVVYISCTNPTASTGIDLTGGTLMNPSLKSTDLVFMVTSSCTNVKVTGGTNASYAVYAPDTDVTLAGGADLYGAIVGKTITNTGGSFVHRDLALSSLEIGDFVCGQVEVSRASPVITTIDGTSALVQGTYLNGIGTRPAISTLTDLDTWRFPYQTGHLRARSSSSISTSGSVYSTNTVIFDAAASGKIPSINNSGCSSFTGTCRNMFTVTQTPTNGVSYRPPLVQFKDSNASTIGALIAPTTAVSGIGASQWQTIVRTVLSARFGGVDRSTAAVIPASNVAGVATRPTIAYVGATDGMLHAICASTGGTTESATSVCPSLGTELWAFMPRVQLPLVRKNTTRIDGSVRVVDAFGDFTSTQSGTRTFRTILTLQTGYADTSIGAVPAVYALDVTDPANPVVLWEYTASTSTTFELGVGLALAAGPSLVNNRLANYVIAATNNGGTGGAGVVATALSLERGTKQWQFGYVYPAPPRGVSADTNVPTSGIPGGATAVDLTGQGYTTDIVMGDLYGNLWRLDAATGTSKTGSGIPLFQFSTNKHAIGATPAIYSSGGVQHAAFASGGYADHVGATWMASSQSLISISITATGPYPINESSSKLALKQDLTSGEKAFAQVLVVGNEIFLATDTTDVNAITYGTTDTNTGHVMRVDVATKANTTIVVRGGASSLANAGTTVYGSTSDKQQQLTTGATSTTGATVDTLIAAKTVRLAWLRTQ